MTNEDLTKRSNETKIFVKSNTRFIINSKFSTAMDTRILFIILFNTTGFALHLLAQNNYEVNYVISELNGAHILLETQNIYPDYLISHNSTLSINSITTMNDEEVRAAVEKAAATDETLTMAIDRSHYVRPKGIDFDVFKARDSEYYYRSLWDPRAEAQKSGMRDSMWLTLVRDSLVQLNWSIEDELKLIYEIKCRKATMTYRCKDYVAWFDPNTPLPIGPEQFGGLPGIIVAMSRSVDNVTWQLQSFNLISEKEKIDINEIKSGIEHSSSISWCEYGNILREYVDFVSNFFSNEDCKTCESKITFTYLECFDDCK